MLDISKKFAGKVIILNDVTDYLEAIAAAEDGNLAKSAFLATVSHEIRTPINSIIGLTEIFDNSNLSKNQKRHLSDIRASGRVLAELTENILGLSSGEANALRRLDQDFDLPTALDNLRPVIEPDLAKRGLTLKVDIAPGVPRHLHGDVGKLRHILLNLLSNAIKFTTQGHVTLRVALSDGTPGRDLTLRFEVIDTGVGLPAGGIDWLFAPFTQYVHPNVVTSLRGTGLGLAICKQMVEFLGGRISAAANPEGGSVFWFEIPVAPASAPLPGMGSGPSLSVLVVEDDAIHALVAHGLLSDLGHAAVLVQGYDAALRALHCQKFDLVLTDQRLEGGSGLDLSASLRRDSDPALNRLPVILVTAHIPPDAKAAQERGDVQHFIEKPISRQDLDRAIRQVIATSLDGAAHDDQTQAAEHAEAAKDDEENLPVLDHDALDQLIKDLGVDRADRIVNCFLSGVPERRQTLSRGLACEDLALIVETAHQMTSASGYVGLPRLAEAARRLHECASSDNIRCAGRRVRELNMQIESGTAALTTKWHELRERYGRLA